MLLLLFVCLFSADSRRGSQRDSEHVRNSTCFAGLKMVRAIEKGMQGASRSRELPEMTASKETTGTEFNQTPE